MGRLEGLQDAIAETRKFVEDAEKNGPAERGMARFGSLEYDEIVDWIHAGEMAAKTLELLEEERSSIESRSAMRDRRRRRENLEPVLEFHDRDGLTSMKYYALHGDDWSTEEVGWIVAVIAPDAPDPQAITVAEAMGDIRTMVPPDDVAAETVVRDYTERMIEGLEAWAERSEAAGADSKPALDRAEALRRELAEAFGSDDAASMSSTGSAE
jgi:hypothetical protein